MITSTNKIKQIKAIKNGKGLQYILDAAYKILGNPILTHDMEYKVIVHNKNNNDDSIWNEFVTTGTVGYDRLEFYKNECFFEMAANAEKITFLLSDKLPYDRLFGKRFHTLTFVSLMGYLNKKYFCHNRNSDLSRNGTCNIQPNKLAEFGFRMLAVEKYIILYKIDKNTVRIHRVFSDFHIVL